MTCDLPRLAVDQPSLAGESTGLSFESTITRMNSLIYIVKKMLRNKFLADKITSTNYGKL